MFAYKYSQVTANRPTAGRANMNSNFKLLTFPQAAKFLPGHPHVSTLHRWRLRGVKGVRLQTMLVGGRRFVSRYALAQFVAAVTAKAEAEPPPARTPRQRQRAIFHAERELGLTGGPLASESKNHERGTS